ncbi:MAG TPA: hypothetical protein VGG14_02780 [Candidatus Sulfotelmatobacter sp.]
MARGWESKSIEAQQEEAAQNKSPAKPLLTREEADGARELASLHLTLNRVIEQLAMATNPRYRAMLDLARNDLERQIDACDRRSHHQTVSPSGS